MPGLPLIIDCDPGVDDAVALLLALAAPEALEVLAITTVAGNVGGDLTARNAGLINAQIVAPSPMVAGSSNSSSSANITATRAAMTARAARAPHGKIAWRCPRCRAQIAPLRCWQP